jgi:ABC-type glycerol-3-phosphate transport system substrate-binding protein
MMLRNPFAGRGRFRVARLTAAVAVAAVAALALSACGAGGSSSGSSAKSLTVLVEAGGHAELQPIADAYQKKTGTKITFVELPYDGLYNRLNSEFTSGSTSFDVAALDAIWLKAFAGGVAPLNDLFTKSVKSDLFPGLLTEANIDGNFVGMPAWTNTEILYYRTDLFDDATNKADFEKQYGYPLAPPTTWQHYSDVAKFFTRDTNGDGQPDLYGTDVKGAVETEFLATVSQAGEKHMVLDGSKVTLNDADSKKALDFYTSLLPYAPTGAAQLDWAGSQNLFYQGKLAMMRFWGHAYTQTPKDSSVFGKVGVAPMIAGPGGVAGVPGAWYLSVPKTGKHNAQSEDFIKFAYENNAMSIKTSLGLAARVSAFDKYKDVKGHENLAAMLTTLNSEATAPRPATAKWQQIVDTVLTPMLQKAVVPGADNQALLDAAQKQVEAIIK